jgi:Amt family ammonium transporter
VGGWGALAGVLLLGPRLGKYKDGKVNPILGHNMPLATDRRVPPLAGLVRLQRRLGPLGQPAATSLVLVTTSLAAAAGGVVRPSLPGSCSKSPISPWR